MNIDAEASMGYELKSARYLARDVLRQALPAGGIAVDATMGNGHDTLFLAEQVGETGHVYAFDIQADALVSTRALLEANGVTDRVTLLHRSHADLAEAVPQKADAVVFNLGWLPGGDHRITTLCGSTEKAVLSALEFLRPGGVVTICAYPGHEEGTRELDMLVRLVSSLSNRQYNALRQSFLNAGEGAPECFVIQKLNSK